MTVRYYDLERLRVLAIDDDRNMRLIWERLLYAIGVGAVLSAPDAANGREALARWQPDLVIVDYDMPHKSGLEFIRELRRSGPLPCVPVVLATGHADLDIVRAARDAGANDVLIKPVTVREFYRRLAALIERPRLFVRSLDYVGPCRRHGRVDGYTGEERRKDRVAVTSAVDFRRELLARLGEIAATSGLSS